MKETVNKLVRYAQDRRIDISVAFDEMLDFFIKTFDTGHLISHRFDMVSVLAACQAEDPALADIQERWIRITTGEIAEHGCYDFFGTMYESAVQGKLKSAVMGQFFTPMSLCMAIPPAGCSGTGVVEDCACGSGRTLLAHWATTERRDDCYYRGADLDPLCVKMCALNMMIHGMIGSVAHANSLTGEVFGRYMVNEVKWPLPTPACSIRHIVEL